MSCGEQGAIAFYSFCFCSCFSLCLARSMNSKPNWMGRATCNCYSSISHLSIILPTHFKSLTDYLLPPLLQVTI